MTRDSDWNRSFMKNVTMCSAHGQPLTPAFSGRRLVVATLCPHPVTRDTAEPRVLREPFQSAKGTKQETTVRHSVATTQTTATSVPRPLKTGPVLLNYTPIYGLRFFSLRLSNTGALKPLIVTKMFVICCFAEVISVSLSTRHDSYSDAHQFCLFPLLWGQGGWEMGLWLQRGSGELTSVGPCAWLHVYYYERRKRNALLS